MQMKWLTSIMFFLVIAVLTFAGCSGADSTEEADGSEGNNESALDQEITYASTTEVLGLSPIDTNDSASARAIEQIYETLFKRNPETMEIEPHLAESYENPDDNTWTIQLKEGIEFHDGTPLNAEAVKYTFEEFIDPDRAAPRASLLEPIETVEVEDEYTVSIITHEPYGAMLAALSHSNASIVSPTADENQDINEEPVGTGPFKYDEWVKGDYLSLVSNSDYWQGEPVLEQVTFNVVPDTSTAISMMETGEVDFIDDLTSEHINRLEGIQDVEVYKEEGTPVYYFAFNMDKEPMNEPEFRQALAYAIDQEEYISSLDGLGTLSNSIVGPMVFGYEESIEEQGYGFDPDEAQKIIEDNDYEGTTIHMLTDNSDSFMNMAEIVQDQLAQVGINAEIDSMEWGTYLDETSNGNYDVTFLSWSNNTADGSELLYPLFHSDNLGSSNRSQYSNSDIDQLIDESRNTTDQEVRHEKIAEANELLIDEAIGVPMHHEVVNIAYVNTVNGIELDPTGRWELYHVTRE